MKHFETTYISKFPVVNLPERINASNSQQMVDTIQAEIAKEQFVIVLDFSNTLAIDSSALGAIVHLYKSLRVGEGDLLFAAVGEHVHRVLALTRLDRVFTLHSSVDKAVQAIAA